MKIDDVVTGAQSYGNDIDFLTFEGILSHNLTRIGSFGTASPRVLIPSVDPRVSRAQDGRHLELTLRATDLLSGDLLSENEKAESKGRKDQEKPHVAFASHGTVCILPRPSRVIER